LRNSIDTRRPVGGRPMSSPVWTPVKVLRQAAKDSVGSELVPR